ncbi:thioredoxin [Flavobacterium akiainvivens]|uniref:Thioredoxin n=1 Tax=Flavobacterium akiainvivens TaxID=1202724 RepID=A0A0M8MCQ2_9FLAO|nr:thioredoxin family protein [Flavobacterium akiainvivens]KOS07425.1 thioredoxin [Flavobacterium akiainvivens]SFQ48007.1 Thiol-disulfide isomerase or thioredoxin [Flavobacterium akiainvivens]
MTATETLIEKSLQNSHSYADYRQHVTALLEQGLSTGNTQSEALTHYTTLNEARMNRLDKTIHLTDEATQRLKALNKEHILLVITEGWCGDAAQIVPVINKLVEANDKLSLRLVLRDENEALMDEYLTNGARSIPKLVLVEKDTLTARGSWGPRPHGGAALIADYKARPEGINEEAKTELQKWYLHDKGQSTVEEITLLLENSENM